jgi:hypothetical protein
MSMSLQGRIYTATCTKLQDRTDSRRSGGVGVVYIGSVLCEKGQVNTIEGGYVSDNQQPNMNGS